MLVNENYVLQPFHMSVFPLKKLFLINIDKNPDKIYGGFELQYFEDEKQKGYRMIAYRRDGYVDVYDEDTLMPPDNSSFQVCGNGLKQYSRDRLMRAYMEKLEEGIQMAFTFRDYEDRIIQASVKEHSNKKSRYIDMIAPVGVSSKNPEFFPLFSMYQFDLVRKKGTEFLLQIDGVDFVSDNFPIPIPKDGQLRFFSRYGCDCELVEVCQNGKRILEPLLCENNQLIQENLIGNYEIFNNELQLKRLEIKDRPHVTALEFEPTFPDLLRMEEGLREGNLQICMDQSMGRVSGKYSVRKENGYAEITWKFTGGWTAEAKTFFTKVMFQKKMIFSTWPKTYQYKQKICLSTGESESKWERIGGN